MLWLPALVAWPLVTVVALHASLRIGRLSVLSTYDDISYLCQPALSLHALQAGGFRGLVAQLWQEPPHSLILWVTGFLGQLVLGVHDWVPYAAHSVVLLFVLAFAAWLLRFAPAWLRWIGVGFVALLPVSWQTVGELRPDFAASFLTAAACILAVERPAGPASRGRRWVIASLIALALLAKPTFFPATIALAGFGCLLGGAVRALRAREGRVALFGRVFVGSLKVAGLALAIVAPYFALIGPRLISYIRDTLYSDQTSVWSFGTDKFTPAQHLGYYFKEGAHPMMEHGLWACIAVAGASGLVAIVRGSLRTRLSAVALLALTLASFAIVYVNVIKTPYFGLTFYSFLVLGAVAAMGGALTTDRLRPGPGLLTIATGLVPCVALAGAVVEFEIPRSPVASPSSALRRADPIFREAIAEAAKHAPRENARVLVPAVGHLGFVAVTYEGLKLGTRLDAYTFWFVTDEAAYERSFDVADMVLLADRHTEETNPHFPVLGVLDRIGVQIAARTDFRLARAWRTPAGGTISLYTRHPDFTGFVARSGLGAPEGPFPRWNLPVVRWVFAPEAVVALDAPERPGPRAAWLRLRRYQPGQTLAVFADGREIARSDLPETVNDLIVPVPEDAVMLTLRCEQPGLTGPPGSTLLLEALAVLPEPSARA
ncbi:MAG: hypothetical protein SFY95_10975, partial [Planctomycetota bacterium]|nr:hypothetical protein [Planctomycetota bacterium]